MMTDTPDDMELHRKLDAEAEAEYNQQQVKHIFPIMEGNLVPQELKEHKASGCFNCGVYLGYEEGKIGQRTADEKALNERLDREKIAELLAVQDGWTWPFVKKDVELHEMFRRRAGEIIKLVREG